MSSNNWLGKLILGLFLLAAPLAFGAGSTSAATMRSGSSLPATCTPTTGGAERNLFYKSTATIGLYYCSAANTWTATGASSCTDNGSGTLTCTVFATNASNGGISAVEGTGAGLTAAAGTDLLWADSTGHCFKVNLNNVAAGCLAAIDKAQTWTGTQTFAAVIGSSFASTTANAASAGFVRLASTDSIKFRNNANGADVALSKTGAASGTVAADAIDLSGFGTVKVPVGAAGAAGISFGGNTQLYDVSNSLRIGYTGKNAAISFNNGSGGDVSIISTGHFAFSSSATDPTTFDAAFNRIGNALIGVGSAGTTDASLSLTSIQYRGLAQTYFVTSDFTTSGVGTALEAITGLSWTFPANIAMNARVDCNLLYAQNVANVAVAFGFQDATVAPTNLAASGIQYTSATASTEGTLAASATTTATNVTSATPSAITTIWHAQLHFLIEQPSNASTSAFTIRVSTATAADTVTIKRGSYCSLTQ